MAKFFTTVQSETGKKHQIGNKFITVEFFTGSKENSRKIGSFTLEEDSVSKDYIIVFDKEVIKRVPVFRK